METLICSNEVYETGWWGLQDRRWLLVGTIDYSTFVLEIKREINFQKQGRGIPILNDEDQNIESTLVDKTCLWDKIQSARKKAEVAELADALRSGRSEGSLMWVQVPPSAQTRLAVRRVFLFERFQS